MTRFLAVILLVLLSSCDAAEKPVTKAEALQLGKSLDSCIRKRNGKAFDDLFNASLLTKRLKSKSILSDAARNKGIREGLKKAGLGNQIINALQTSNDGYSLVKYYESNGVQHLIYRLHGTGGFNYHDFELQRYRGKVYIADIYVYASGENFSKTLSDLLESTGDWDVKQKNNFATIDKIKKLLNQNRAKEARDNFDKLDPAFRSQRSVRLIYVLVCSKLEEEAYLKALDQFISQYPNDANTCLLMIDVCFLRKDFVQAKHYVDKLDSLIDKDPFLDYYRGLIAKSQGEIMEANKHLENLHSNMPEFAGGVIELIANYLDLEKYDKAKQLISYYRSHNKFSQENLDYVLALYPDFKE